MTSNRKLVALLLVAVASPWALPALQPAGTAYAGPPGPAPYPAQISTWSLPAGDPSGVGWTLAIDDSRDTLLVAELISIDPPYPEEPRVVVRVRAFSTAGRLLATADVPSSANGTQSARPLVAVDDDAGLLYVVTSDPLDSSPEAVVARLSTAPTTGNGEPPTLPPPDSGPATIRLPLPRGGVPVELKDLAVDPTTHELVLAARTVESTSIENGGQFVWRYDGESGRRTAIVASDPDGSTGGPGRTRLTVAADGAIYLLGQPYGTGAPAGVWRFEAGAHDVTPSPIPTYASRNVTRPEAPPPGFGVRLRNPFDELSAAIQVDSAGRLLVPFDAPVAPPPGQPVPERIDTAIAVLDPRTTGTLADPAFPEVPFAPIVQLIAGDGVRRGALPFWAGGYACHLGQDDQTGDYDFVVSRETVAGAPSDVVYVLTKRWQLHNEAVIMKIGPRAPGSLSCFGPPYARLGGDPGRPVPRGTTVHLDVGTSIDPNVADPYLQPTGIFRVEWDLTSDRFEPGDHIIRKQVPLGEPPDTRLDLEVNQDQFVAVRVWNAAGLKSNVRTTTIRVE